jgi:hypothetical protein
MTRFLRTSQPMPPAPTTSTREDLMATRVSSPYTAARDEYLLRCWLIVAARCGRKQRNNGRRRERDIFHFTDCNLNFLERWRDRETSPFLDRQRRGKFKSSSTLYPRQTEHQRMATRNLTRRFVDIRNASKANRSLSRYEKDESSESGLLVDPCLSSCLDRTPFSLLQDNHNQWKAAKDTLPPLWVDSIEQAESDLAKIQSKSESAAVFELALTDGSGSQCENWLRCTQSGSW